MKKVFFNSVIIHFASLCFLFNAAAQTLKGPESAAQARYQAQEYSKGVVVSGDVQASEWGAQILRQGGNAIDAAFATAIMLSVTRPQYASLGGGGFLVYCPKSTPQHQNPCVALDFRERAPLIIPSSFTNSTNPSSALNVGVPGTVSGLLTSLEKWGTLPRQKLMKEAIDTAYKGYLFTSRAEYSATQRWKKMNAEAKNILGCLNSQKVLEPCPTGTLIRQTDLAHVLSQISRHGISAFYSGKIPQTIVNEVKKAGGILTQEDFKTYKPIFREVMKVQVSDYEMITVPPPSSGGILLAQLLNYAEFANKQEHLKKGFGSADTIHALSHAMGLTFADRSENLGDPDFIAYDWEQLLKPEYLEEQWKTYQPKKSFFKTQNKKQFSVQESFHTTHIAVLDKFGNSVSMTLSINDIFGSNFVPKGTGIFMNDELTEFTSQSHESNLDGVSLSKANEIAPLKRPLSTMTPVIIRDSKQQVKLIIGAAGGPRIVSSIFLTLINHFNFKMSLLDALIAPRFHHQWKPETLFLETNGFPFEIKTDLEKRGYTLLETLSLGEVQAISVLSNGRITGATDPRGEGAIAYE